MLLSFAWIARQQNVEQPCSLIWLANSTECLPWLLITLEDRTPQCKQQMPFEISIIQERSHLTLLPLLPRRWYGSFQFSRTSIIHPICYCRPCLWRCYRNNHLRINMYSVMRPGQNLAPVIWKWVPKKRLGLAVNCDRNSVQIFRILSKRHHFI